ncbi:MAG: hypothetical protein H0U52_04410 [Chloroflexi bacterium]|nr:hypothetical protein [Chloroflexota bacterium]
MIPRRSLLAGGAALSILIAACGAPPPSSSFPTSSASASGTPSVLPVPVSSEFRVGENRTIFSVADPTGQKPVAKPDRTLAIGYRGPNSESITAAPQTFVWAIEGVSGVYVGRASFASAGKWIADFTTEAPGSPKETMSFSFDVRQTVRVLSPGDPAPSVKTPTIADVGGDVAKVSTDTKPVKRFYEVSEAAALAAKKPFVLIFATPKFCQTATCGPTLDKLKPVAAAHPELTFINVEPYKLELVAGQLQPVLDDGNLVTVEATNAFKLSTEPYVFVVGSDGRISASFELVFSAEELEAAIQAVE